MPMGAGVDEGYGLVCSITGADRDDVVTIGELEAHHRHRNGEDRRAERQANVLLERIQEADRLLSLAVAVDRRRPSLGSF
jgi:hypothetical protein